MSAGNPRFRRWQRVSALRFRVESEAETTEPRPRIWQSAAEAPATNLSKQKGA